MTTEREIHFPAKDEPLRRDVSALGALVGEVIREQGGEELFALVEAAREAAIRRRASAGTARTAAGEELIARVTGLPAARAEELVRAFSTYFRVVNLAERAHRIRRRRDYQRAGEVQRGSPEEAFGALAANGLSLAEARELLARLSIEPVFTAHPTEATRRTLLEKQQRIMRVLVEGMDPSRTPREERAATARARAEITAAWQTEEHPARRPRVEDEMEHVLFYLTDVLYPVLPAFYESLEDALAAVWGEAAREARVPTLLRFASWVGGDMDGNPNVTAATLRATLAEHRRLVLGLYLKEAGQLARRLSQSLSRVAVAPEVEARAAAYGELFPTDRDAIHPRHRDMPYRALLRLMAARLRATLEDGEHAYGGPEGFLADLDLIAASLAAHRGEHAGLFAVRRLRRRAETFGFHLATLDVRQDALVHRRVAGRLLGDEGWLERSAAERAERLRRVLAAGVGEAEAAPEDEESAATLDVFRAMAEGRRRYGERALGPFILSMARGADDVLTALLLARHAGLGELDVAPLFETVADLEAAPGVMAELAADPLYRAHLEARGNRQMIMLGYSDSNKDGGLAASRWALQKAQGTLVETLAGAGVALTLFHGRGGSISRGGGKTHRAVLAAPRGAVDGRLRLTEQGEVIDATYGVRAIALRNLGRATGAVALATAAPAPDDPRLPRWREVMEDLAAASRRAYRGLVYEDPDFPEYFRRATPIDVIERLAIGSRPASRRGQSGIEDLRAIPWVFAWTQSRHLLPGWYGLGTGLAEAIAHHGRDVLREMAGAGEDAGWPFFANLLADAEMVLAKADLPIAGRYARLAGDAGRRLFPTVEAEFERARDGVLDLTAAAHPLDSDPALKRSIQLRNPYVDPMSLLQVDLLERWRAGGREDASLLRALKATVQGIAQGLQNTG